MAQSFTLLLLNKLEFFEKQLLNNPTSKQNIHNPLLMYEQKVTTGSCFFFFSFFFLHISSKIVWVTFFLEITIITPYVAKLH